MAMQAEELLRPLTYQDLDDFDDPLMRYEIIGGELIVSPAASLDHGDIVLALAIEFRRIAMAGNLGHVWVAPGDVELSVHNVVQPDVFFVVQSRMGIAKRFLQGQPDLAIEVVSPGSRVRDYVAKRVLYEAAGVTEYWIVDPMRRAIEVLTLESSRYVSINHDDGIARSSVVPGVAIDIARLFDEFEP
jgi:Uma2 family endonuclease